MAAGDHYPVFQSILQGLASEGATSGQMMGHPCLKTPAGKVPAVYWHDSLVVKLPPADLEIWLEESDVQMFQPVRGRPMRGWAQIPSRYVDEWEKLVSESFEYVTA